MMSTRILDGITFDMPPTAGQVLQLADLHRQKLDNVISDRHAPVGHSGLAQRQDVHDFNGALDENQRPEFYSLYNPDPVRILTEDRWHPPQAEAGLTKFAIFL